MAGVADYLDLLVEYQRMFRALASGPGRVRLYPAAAELSIAMFRLEEAVRAIAQDSAGPEEQSQGMVLRHAQAVDRILHDLLHQAGRQPEWVRHQRNVQSIIGRWPGVKPGSKRM